MRAESINLDRMFTAEEYLALPDLGFPNELVRGRVIEMNVPAPTARANLRKG